MKALVQSFFMVFRQVRKDSMLIMVCFASVLAGLFFRFAIPRLETLLCTYFMKSSILEPHYRLFDLVLNLLAPYMLCFAASMVMLDEYDQNMTRYLSVTPLKKSGYIVSHLVIPAVLSTVVSMILVVAFHLTVWSFLDLVAVSIVSLLSAFSVALFIFTFSHNKLEGMAMAKLSGCILLGLPVPFFVQAELQYLFFAFPSFWIAKFSKEGHVVFFLVAFVLSLAYIPPFLHKVERKIV
ncbi:MAG: hypothetical protein WC136_12055 [Sphaerochaeta sp.]